MARRNADLLIRFIRRTLSPSDAQSDEQLLRRFAAERDQTAFAALVARHGPMVLGVCQRLLRDPNDAEDAFQATFLVLARKADGLTRPHLLAPWLYGVARRTALEAKARAAKRHGRQRQAGDVAYAQQRGSRDRAMADPTLPVVWADLRRVLDEEIDRLPERYRVPFVLCFLEGRTNAEAARLLGCPTGTVLSRLAWARQRLRCRLTRRGVTLSAGLCATGLVGGPAVAPTLASGTAAAAASFAEGTPAAGSVAAKVGCLATEVLRHMVWTRIRNATGLLMALGLLIGGSGILAWSSPGHDRDGLVAAAPVEVVVCQPLAREVTDYEDFSGRTEAVSVLEVGAQVNGLVTKVHVDDGAQVKRGELLFEIDPRPYEAELRKAEANLVVSEARLKQAETDYQRAKALPAKDVPAAQQELDKTAALREEAQARVKVAKAAYERARLHLSWTRVNAPIDGRLRRQVVLGQLVRASQTILATLVSQGPLYVYFNVDERTALQLARTMKEGRLRSRDWVGLPVQVGLSDEQGFPRQGQVDFADARIDTRQGTLRLRAILPNDDGLLLPGLFARVRLAIGPPYLALLVPERAVGVDQGQQCLFLVNAQNVIERRAVQLGQSHDGLRVVKHGLRLSDWVALGDLQKLRHGMTVKPLKVAVVGHEAKRPLQTGKGAAGPGEDPKTKTVTVQLKHASATEVVKILGDVCREKAPSTGRLSLVTDDAANVLFIRGPRDQVAEIAALVQRFDEMRGQKEARETTRPTGRGAKPRLGVSVEPVSAALADQLRLPAGTGLLVTQVLPNSPGAKVGIQVNDVLLKIDGAQVPADRNDFAQLIASLKSDEPLEIVVLRKGRRQSLGRVKLD